MYISRHRRQYVSRVTSVELAIRQYVSRVSYTSIVWSHHRSAAVARNPPACRSARFRVIWLTSTAPGRGGLGRGRSRGAASDPAPLKGYARLSERRAPTSAAAPPPPLRAQIDDRADDANQDQWWVKAAV